MWIFVKWNILLFIYYYELFFYIDCTFQASTWGGIYDPENESNNVNVLFFIIMFIYDVSLHLLQTQGINGGNFERNI